MNSPEELDRLTKEDPVFKQMILQRGQAKARAQLIREDLLGRKKTMDAEIDKLRQTVASSPEAIANLLKNWLSEEKGGKP